MKGPRPVIDPTAPRRARLRIVRNHLAAGYPIDAAQRAAAQHARHHLGLIPIRDDEPHYLPELGLTPRQEPA
ncbi:hypothetical protein [Deinococcus sp. 6GRE01]|uniref:hypothetical protein n=1 Tax=Deinococcus sp. 6GRE01 TaxID=2745873 RepID=UPI001E5E1602|nr:hypothetical protein [Deinococcus sp. 6GRE01]MCD0155953.1 hypothetical protein [Deinococcus sp. 6GRE01]